MNLSSWNYQKAGVNVNKANYLIKKLKEIVPKPKNLLKGIGSFSAIYKLKEELNLALACDGVGTKLLVAEKMNYWEDIGQDLVAMVVNDIVCEKAEPLLFMDYISCGKLNEEIVMAIWKSILNSCNNINCYLVGGELAEMPDFYRESQYELVGFCLGILIDNYFPPLQVKDVIIGIHSSGIHSNGISLVRKILESKNISYDYTPPSWKISVGKEILKPTLLYSPCIIELWKKKLIKTAAHITGGGLIENVSRVIPEGLLAVIYKKKLPEKKIFQFIQKIGSVPDNEMYRVFNMGIGFVVISEQSKINEILDVINKFNFKCSIIGEIVKQEDEQKVKIV